MAQKRFGGWKWLILAVAIVAIAGGIWYFNRDDDSAPQYVTATVTRGDLTQVVTATGTLNPVVNVQVGSQISGIIQNLYADFNSSVTSNQIIARLDPSTYQANVHSAEGDLANAKAGLEFAQVDARRAEDLFAAKLISQSDYDKAMATLHQSEAQVKIKEASLENARISLARCTIYSPVDGTVISRNVDIGQTVAASMSAPVLFQVANDLTKMQIDANVSEADIGTIKEGQQVTFTVDAFPDHKFIGKVRQIRNAPTTVQNVVTYDAVIDVNNPDGELRPGMTANASIITAQRSGALKVPNAALRFRPPEPGTNQTFFARLLAKLKGGETKSAATNSALAVKAGDTNKTEVAANGEAPLTGNEPPEEFMRRVREMRDRGEELPPAIRAKMRELFQSGAIQRPGGGGGGPGGGGPGGGAPRSRPSGPASRTIYIMAAASTADGGDPPAAPQPIRVRTGISDGAYTEISEGLKEGDLVVTAVKLPQADVAAAPAGASPFGGGGGGGFGRGGGGRGGR